MRIGLATAAAWLTLALASGCAPTSDTSAHDTARAGGTGLLVTPTAAAPLTSATHSPTPETQASGSSNSISLIERLPTLADRGEPSPRPNLELRADAWREVAVIQMALNAVSSSGLDVDGHFGPSTDAAVRAFQSTRGIDVDGYVGPETLRELVDALSEAGGAVPPPTVTNVSPTTQPFYGLSGGTVCSDGWISTSSGSGTCSWHGGIK